MKKSTSSSPSFLSCSGVPGWILAGVGWVSILKGSENDRLEGDAGLSRPEHRGRNDHVQPVKQGGPTEPANGQALCPRCNLIKGARRA